MSFIRRNDHLVDDSHGNTARVRTTLKQVGGQPEVVALYVAAADPDRPVVIDRQMLRWITRRVLDDCEGWDRQPIPQPEPEPSYDGPLVPLNDANLDTRSRNCLLREGLTYLHEAQAMSDESLLDIRNFGAGSLMSLRQARGKRRPIRRKLEPQNFSGVRTPADLRALNLLRESAKNNNLRSVRENANLSKAEVARASGISQRSIWRWETGVQQPTGEAAAKYANLLVAIGALA